LNLVDTTFILFFSVGLYRRIAFPEWGIPRSCLERGESQ
jgi:hypothetical protein